MYTPKNKSVPITRVANRFLGPDAFLISQIKQPGRIGMIYRLVAAIAIGLVGFNKNLVAQPTIINLGTLPDGYLSVANAISADGSTVTGYSNYGQFQPNRAFRWTESDGMIDLGTLPAYSTSIGNGVSEDGSVIVGGGSGFQHAWHWSNDGGMEDLGTFPGGANSTALDISSDGSIVTGWSQSNSRPVGQRPFRWTQSNGMQDLGVLPGGNAGASTAVSGDGQYFAGYTNYAGSGSGTHAVRWTPNGIEDLGALLGSASAYAISHDGSVVVGVTATSNGSRAFRWTEAEGMVNLGVPFPSTFPDSIALAVSGDGTTVGGSHFGGNFALLWRKDLGTVDFQSWLTMQGTDVSGWVLSSISGISHDGSIITGTGSFNNQQRAWVVNLNSAEVCAGSGVLIEGFRETGDFNATCGSDDSYWTAHGASLFFQISDPVVQFELTATAPVGAAGSNINVEIEASKLNASANLTLRAQLFNFTTERYVSLPGVMPLATTDGIQNFSLPAGSDPADFIEPGTNEVRLLLQTIQTSGLPNVRTQLDQVSFFFE